MQSWMLLVAVWLLAGPFVLAVWTILAIGNAILHYCRAAISTSWFADQPRGLGAPN
jgi:hypothetical protein